MGQRHQVYVKKVIEDKAVIMPFHIQFLWGRGVVYNAGKLLEFLDNCAKYEYSHRIDEWDEKRWIDILLHTMGFTMNYEAMPGRWGLNNFSYLDFPDCKIFMDRGDNNDGVLIVDADTRKYCLMAFENRETLEGVDRFELLTLEELAEIFPLQPEFKTAENAPR